MKEDLLKIILYYGVNAQQRKLAEEVFELQEAITTYENEPLNFLGAGNKEHIAEEIADVLNLLSQFVAYYELNEYEIYEIAYKKVDRQLERIENE